MKTVLASVKMMSGHFKANYFFNWFNELSIFCLILQCNELFTWKTKKLGVGVQLQSKAASGPPTKKFKVNVTKMKYSDI